jgi:quercetin dioxygenase-like cupin family protein
MSGPTVTAPGAGEVVGDSSDRRVEILAEHDAMHATWSRFGPRRDGADLHVHRRHTDIFYVLAGELTVRLGVEDANVVVPAGELVRVPPLVVHGYRNGGDAELRYLNFHAPGQGFAEYMRGLAAGRRVPFDQEPRPADGGRPTTEAVIGGGGAVLADVEPIGIASASIEPGAPVPAHVHRRHVESLYVLAGELALTIGDRELRARAGSWVELPPGVPHALSAAGAEPVRLLDLQTPSCGLGALDQHPA